MGLLPHWRIEYTDDMAPDDRGLTIWAEQRILLRRDLTCAERCSTICHEAGHVLRGPYASAHRIREEALVERQAARLLMPSRYRLGHAMAWHGADYERTAAELWVDEKLLNAHLSTLAPKEREYLDEQLATI